MGGGIKGKVERWGHRASCTCCHPFLVKCWELAALGAASFLWPRVPCSHKGEHWLHGGMKQPGGRTSSRQADSMRLWAQFSCFKPERWPGPKTQSQAASCLSKLQRSMSGLWLIPPFSKQASASHPPPQGAGCMHAVIDGTGSYLCVSILYIPSSACWGDLTPCGYLGLVWGPCSVFLSHFTPELQWGPELTQL